MRRTLYRKRRWLNNLTEHSVAFVWADLTHNSGVDEEDNSKWEVVSGEIKIGDCARYITLDFSDDYNSVQKIRKLIGLLGEFEAALLKAVDEQPWKKTV